MSNFYWNSYYF